MKGKNIIMYVIVSFSCLYTKIEISMHAYVQGNPQSSSDYPEYYS